MQNSFVKINKKKSNLFYYCILTIKEAGTREINFGSYIPIIPIWALISGG